MNRGTNGKEEIVIKIEVLRAAKAFTLAQN